MAAMDEKIPGVGGTPANVGAPNPAMLEFLKAMFSAPNAAAGAPGGGQPSVQMPSRVVTGPPQVNNPSPGNPNTPPSSAGAGAAMPAMPAGASPQQAVPAYSGPNEFSTGQGRAGAVTSSALGSVFGAIHQMTEKKNQDQIQHAQFLYDMVKTAQAAGDQQTVNAVMGDAKKRKLIEKYLTGELPRVPQQAGQQPKANPKVNEPGGVALPRPSQQSKNDAMMADIVGKRLQREDPATIEALIGQGASLTPDQYRKYSMSKFGFELSGAQIQGLTIEGSQALEQARQKILADMLGKKADYEKAVEVEKMRGVSSAADTAATVKGQQSVAAMNNAARRDVAGIYAASRKEIAAAKPDSMDKVIYQSNAKVYLANSQGDEKLAALYEKQGDKANMKKYQESAAKWKAEAENQQKQYEYNKEAQELLKGLNIQMPDPSE